MRKAERILLIASLAAIALFFSVPALAVSDQTSVGISFYDSSPVPHNQQEAVTTQKQSANFLKPERRNTSYPKTGSKRTSLLFYVIGLELLVIDWLLVRQRSKGERTPHDEKS